MRQEGVTAVGGPPRAPGPGAAPGHMHGEAPPPQGSPHPCWEYPRGPFPLSPIRDLGGFPLISWQRGGCLDRSSRALAVLVRGGKESQQLSPTPG